MPDEKNIFIVRHGETDYNKDGYLQGSSIDSSLNKKGILQAKAFYKAYKDFPFDKIYVSGLKRSYESVVYFTDQGIEIESYIELNEINWGVLEGKKITSESIAYFRELAENWKNENYDVKIPEGESPVDVAKRQSSFLEKIFERKEKNILICMHGRALRIFICQLLNLPLSRMDEFKHDNLGLYHIRFNSGKSKVELLKNNDISHLHNI